MGFRGTTPLGLRAHACRPSLRPDNGGPTVAAYSACPLRLLSVSAVNAVRPFSGAAPGRTSAGEDREALSAYGASSLAARFLPTSPLRCLWLFSTAGCYHTRPSQDKGGEEKNLPMWRFCGRINPARVGTLGATASPAKS